MKVYTYKNCSTCKKATKWLDANGIAYDELPIRETPPTKKELEQMLGHLDGQTKKLFNVSGQDYRQLGLKDRVASMSKAEAFELLRGNGNLVKRPFLIGDGVGLVGFKEDAWADALT